MTKLGFDINTRGYYNALAEECGVALSALLVAMDAAYTAA